jgi:hypothetical protein
MTMFRKSPDKRAFASGLISSGQNVRSLRGVLQPPRSRLLKIMIRKPFTDKPLTAKNGVHSRYQLTSGIRLNKVAMRSRVKGCLH